MQVDPQCCPAMLLPFPSLCILFSLGWLTISQWSLSSNFSLLKLFPLCCPSPPTKLPNWCPHLIIKWQNGSINKLNLISETTNQRASNTRSSFYLSSVIAVWPQSFPSVPSHPSYLSSHITFLEKSSLYILFLHQNVSYRGYRLCYFYRCIHSSQNDA